MPRRFEESSTRPGESKDIVRIVSKPPDNGLVEVDAVVVIVITVVAVLVPGVTDTGLKLQADNVGRPVQANVIADE